MAAKAFFVLCASTALLKVISAQCLGGALGAMAAEELALGNMAFGGLPMRGAGQYGPGFGPYGMANSVAPTSGGGFAVTSSSPMAPTGITVMSENAIEGPLTVTGQLPFLGTVAVEGTLPTAGAGAINYGCGNGNVEIVSEGLGPVGAGYGPALAPAMGPGVPMAAARGQMGYGPGMGYNGYGGMY